MSHRIAAVLGVAAIFKRAFPRHNRNLIIQNEVVNSLLMPLTADTICCHTFIALISASCQEGKQEDKLYLSVNEGSLKLRVDTAIKGAFCEAFYVLNLLHTFGLCHFLALFRAQFITLLVFGESFLRIAIL